MGKVKRVNRAGIKTPEHAIFVELQTDYNFSPVMARALLERINQYVDELNSDQLRNTQIVCQAIHRNESPGKPISKCRLVPVRLTMTSYEDAKILSEQGAPVLKAVRVKRWFEEAYEQGGVLTQEDVAELLGADISTVKRIVKRYKNEGIILPTRGQIQDIGPGLSHKAKAVELYLKGYTITEISKRMVHTLPSIERYLTDFSKVIMLTNNGLAPANIRVATGLSEFLIEEYIELADKYNKPYYEDRYKQLQGLFSRLGGQEPLKKRGDP